MFERFSPSARAVVGRAYLEASRLHQNEMTAAHLLLALAATETGIASYVLATNRLTPDRIEAGIADTIVFETDHGPLTRSDADALNSIGIDLDGICDQLAESFGPGSLRSTASRRRRFYGHLAFSPDAKRSLAAGLTGAKRLKLGYIGPEHILLGVLADNRSFVVELLGGLGLSAAVLKGQTLDALHRTS